MVNSCDKGEEKLNSAYMLVYEKRVKHSLKLEIFESDGATTPRTVIRESETIHCTMPTSVYQAVLADNGRYFLQNKIYNADFFAFLLETINLAISTAVDISQTMLNVLFKILCRCIDTKLLHDIITALKTLLELFPANIEKFINTHLEDHMQEFKYLLLVCPERSTREAISDLAVFCLIKQSTADVSESCNVKTIISSLLALIPQDTVKYWGHLQQFLELFHNFALGGEVQSVLLLNSGVLSIFIDFYLTENLHLLCPEEKSAIIGNNKVQDLSFDPLIETLAVVSLYCSTANGVRSYDLSNLDKKSLFDPRFYKKILSNLHYCEYACKFIQHLCNEDLKYSEGIAEPLLEALECYDITDKQCLFDVVAIFLTIDDLYVQHRIEWVIGVPRFCKDFTFEANMYYLSGTCIPCMDMDLNPYPSSLGLFNSVNSPLSILNLIWMNYDRRNRVSLVYARHLLKIFTLSDHLSSYAKSLPPPKCRYLSFMHWLDKFVCKSYSENSGGTEDSSEEAYQAMQLFKEKYRLNSEEVYVIGKTVDTRVKSELARGKVAVRVTEYKTEWSVSSPENYARKDLLSMSQEFEQGMDNSEEIPFKDFNLATIEDSPEFVEKLVCTDFTQAKIEVVNSYSSAVRVWLKLNKHPSQNFWGPSSVITVKVFSQASKYAIFLSKIVPENPWPEISFEWGVVYEDSWKPEKNQMILDSKKHFDDNAVNVSDD